MDAPLNEYSVLRGAVVMKMPEQRIRKGLSIFKAKVSDGLNDFMVVIYNNYYGFKALQIGCEYLFYGKVTGNLLRREISSPRIVKCRFKPSCSGLSSHDGAYLGGNIAEYARGFNDIGKRTV